MLIRVVLAVGYGMAFAPWAYAGEQTGAVVGDVEFTFRRDGKIGRGTLSLGSLTVECDSNGNATPVRSNPFQVNGVAGNPIAPFYTLLGRGDVFPGSLSLEITPAPPGGSTKISVRSLRFSRTEQTINGPVVYHTYSIHADFTAFHVNHGSGPGSLDASVTVACPMSISSTPTPTIPPVVTPTQPPPTVTPTIPPPTVTPTIPPPTRTPTPTPTLGLPPVVY